MLPGQQYGDLMTVNDEISKAIQQNLPSAVAFELKTYLESAEADKQSLEKAK